MKIDSETKSTTVQDIGRHIRAIRKANQLTQQGLSDLCGVSRRFISELENGKPTVETGKVLHVLKCIGCDVTLRYRQ